MKLIATIFMSLVGFLMFQPAISLTANASVDKMKGLTTNCMRCAGHCKKEKKNETNNDCNRCNPFMACAYGNFFENAKVIEKLDHPMSLSEKIVPSNDKITSTYIVDCWHPPELIFL